MFSGTERFFRPGYRTFLVANWLPALEGVVAKLQAGAKVADVGCGHGASTLVMAQAFPASTREPGESWRRLPLPLRLLRQEKTTTWANRSPPVAKFRTRVHLR